jgi:hypothetical protein
MRRLRVFYVGLHHADVIGNVAVDGQYVELSVEVVIKEECPERQ